MTDQTQQQQTQEPREYSLTELDNAVAAGQITQSQRDQMWTTQVERRAAKMAETTARQIVETETRFTAIDNQIKEYSTIAPDLMRDGSEVRTRVRAEYDFLVSQGAPPNLTTELAATRTVLGPIERARAYAQGKRRDPDAFGDTAGNPPSPEQRRENDEWGKLSASQRSYYDKMIGQGMYANRAAVLAEVGWKRGANGSNRGTA